MYDGVPAASLEAVGTASTAPFSVEGACNIDFSEGLLVLASVAKPPLGLDVVGGNSDVPIAVLWACSRVSFPNASVVTVPEGVTPRPSSGCRYAARKLSADGGGHGYWPLVDG